MPLRLEDKKQVVAEVAEVAAGAHSAVAAEYRGLSVADMTELRVQARANGVYLRVIKNTLARRAVEGTAFESMQDGFQGPLLLAFSRDDPGAAARVVKDFAKRRQSLKTQMVAVEGTLLDASGLDRLASLPTREQALSQLMALMKAPIEKLVRTLAEPHAKLARTLAAMREQKESSERSGQDSG